MEQAASPLPPPRKGKKKTSKQTKTAELRYGRQEKTVAKKETKSKETKSKEKVGESQAKLGPRVAAANKTTTVFQNLNLN